MEPTKSQEISLSPSEDQVGLRIDQFLGKVPQIQSRTRAEHLISAQLVQVNSQNVKSSYRIQLGDLITVQIPLVSNTETLAPLDLKLEILHEDSDLIVLNKPAGLVVHPAAGHAQDTLVNALINHSDDFQMKFNQNRPGIVHRLDKDTSGVLVVGKNDFAVENLTQQFKARTVHRLYEAAVKAQGLPGHGTIQSYLARSPSDRKKYASLKGAGGKIIRENSPQITLGKWAVTHFTLLKKNLRGQARLELKLETGRTHQIRVHLTEMGWPVLGDPIYGKSAGLNPPRLCLHAKELGFRHPRSDQALHFFCPWPTDTLNYLSELGL